VEITLDTNSKKEKPYIVEPKHQVLTQTDPTYDGRPVQEEVLIVYEKGKVKG
jgi:hypothetical protein